MEAESQLESLQSAWEFCEADIERVEPPRFIIPGLIDTHIHAPQYSFTGTGYDLELLDWLNTYTFPAESQLSNTELAARVYSDVVRRTLKNGTTTACYFATISLESTKRLVDILYEQGQRGLVGKVNMDRNSPDHYVEQTDASVAETREFIEYVKRKEQEQASINGSAAPVRAIVTPRFAPTCSPDLLGKLGALAKEYDLPIQSHISENLNEVAWVKDLFKDELGESVTYTKVYDHFGLLNDKTIMAHGCHLDDQELETFHERGAGVSHCPVSNFALSSGLLRARNALGKKVKIGLGTDVSGGYATSMLEVMRQAIVCSQAVHFNEPEVKPLNFKEVFHLCTVGGAQLVGMEDTLGTFAAGKFFDALVVNPESADSPFNNYSFTASSIEDIFQKFIFLGDDRNIEQVFVNGYNRLARE